MNVEAATEIPETYNVVLQSLMEALATKVLATHIVMLQSVTKGDGDKGEDMTKHTSNEGEERAKEDSGGTWQKPATVARFHVLFLASNFYGLKGI